MAYTKCQGKIAAFIKAGHTRMRTDPKLRCYACTAEAESQWYPLIIANRYPYKITDLGNGHMRVRGTNKKSRYIANSRFCGVVYHAGGGQEL